MAIFTNTKRQGLCSVFLLLSTGACAAAQGEPASPLGTLGDFGAPERPAEEGSKPGARKERGEKRNELDGEAREHSEACDAGDAAACFRLSEIFAKGHGVEPDEARAVTLLAKACEGGHAPAYSVFADRLAAGNGVDWNEERAAALYAKACEGGEAQSCYKLGVLLEEGRGIGKDEARASQFLRRACEVGEEKACAPIHEKDCDAGDASSCFQLGLALDEGRGVRWDRERATELYSKACKGGVAVACTRQTFQAHYAKILKGLGGGNLGSCREKPPIDALRLTTNVLRTLADVPPLAPSGGTVAPDPPRMTSSEFMDLSTKTGRLWFVAANELLAAPATLVLEVRDEVPAIEVLAEWQVTFTGMRGKFKPGSLTARLVRFDSKARATCATQVKVKNTFLEVRHGQNVVEAAREQLFERIPESFGF